MIRGIVFKPGVCSEVEQKMIVGWIAVSQGVTPMMMYAEDPKWIDRGSDLVKRKWAEYQAEKVST